jgi:polar amino acid transport system substrate-binding protein
MRIAPLFLVAFSVLAADLKTDLAPGGTLRAVFLGGNPVQGRPDPKSGEYTGVVPDLVKELARKLAIPYQLIPAPNARGVMDAIKSHSADIGFLAFDETRAREVDFSSPYARMFNTYLVRADSPLAKAADVDRAGIKVGAVKGQSQEIYLSSTLKNAKVIALAQEPPDPELEKMMLNGDFDAFGENRERAEGTASHTAKLRALSDNFSFVGQAFVVEKGNQAKIAALNGFVDEVLASGLVKESLGRANLAGVGPAR